MFFLLFGVLFLIVCVIAENNVNMEEKYIKRIAVLIGRELTGKITEYERGTNIIATPFLYEICKTYLISADYLLGKTDSPKYYK